MVNRLFIVIRDPDNPDFDLGALLEAVDAESK